MNKIAYYDAQGRPRDKYGRLITDDILADGETLKVGLTMMDRDSTAEHWAEARAARIRAFGENPK